MCSASTCDPNLIYLINKQDLILHSLQLGSLVSPTRWFFCILGHWRYIFFFHRTCVSETRPWALHFSSLAEQNSVNKLSPRQTAGVLLPKAHNGSFTVTLQAHLIYRESLIRIDWFLSEAKGNNQIQRTRGAVFMLSWCCDCSAVEA